MGDYTFLIQIKKKTHNPASLPPKNTRPMYTTGNSS